MTSEKLNKNLDIKQCGCGGQPYYDWDTQNGYYIGWVKCPKCGIKTSVFMDKYDINKVIQYSIEKWNEAMKERLTSTIEVDPDHNVYKCSYCGQYFHKTSWSAPVNYCSQCGSRLKWN